MSPLFVCLLFGVSFCLFFSFLETWYCHVVQAAFDPPSYSASLLCECHCHLTWFRLILSQPKLETHVKREAWTSYRMKTSVSVTYRGPETYWLPGAQYCPVGKSWTFPLQSNKSMWPILLKSEVVFQASNASSYRKISFLLIFERKYGHLMFTHEALSNCIMVNRMYVTKNHLWQCKILCWFLRCFYGLDFSNWLSQFHLK